MLCADTDQLDVHAQLYDPRVVELHVGLANAERLRRVPILFRFPQVFAWRPVRATRILDFVDAQYNGSRSDDQREDGGHARQDISRQIGLKS